MDIYSFSIWTYDMAGNISTTYNTDVTSTNYILSDLDNDGVVNFGADLGALASSYDQTSVESFFDVYCDYGPRVDGLPKPDDYVGFDELVIAVSNYAVFGDWMKGNRGVRPLKLSPKCDELFVSAEIPDRLMAGEEFTVSLRCDNPSAIAAYHMVFGFDADQVEVADVSRGEMFNTEEKVFFYEKARGDELMLDGAIFGGEAQFVEDEIARIKFIARAEAELFSLENIELDVRNIEGEEIPASFEVTRVIEPIIPTEFALSQNYPNPFNPTTVIEMALPVASDWTLTIYNIAGQKVTGFNGYSEAGIHRISWDAAAMASGVYFYRFSAGDYTATKKMVLLK
jgi:hypothetical protein